ncbi:flavin-containing monooxygenase [Nocardia mexicana]|uniref:Cation diffusion facilitator CzcD-associated flavoprotein CzcO n=1 Tax=Nocardia mexicana TaxID=279262 RepID=A0A370GMJ3_9NOCA|nr:NAD(P)/FAD-dependent oxidoreductase [Nocardia mexicana]RDI44948.1 cation diffusion facilitator CzcD-associated flavoprotein CzcO [Nocardia mexicana]
MEAPAREPDYEAVVVGAGFGGIGAGVELRRAGIDDFLIVDKNTDVGGTWHVNTYPGVAADTPSIYYSFSYERPRQMSRLFSPGAEVQQYARQVVDRYGLRPHLRLATSVTEARWDDRNSLWHLMFDDGNRVTTRYFISAVGALDIPRLPDIDGLDSYGGKVVHTARWDHDFDYTGKRIAVIGTGSSALQVIPELAEHAERLTVFQRRGIWVLPKRDRPLSPATKRVLELPVLRRMIRTALAGASDLALLGIALYHRRIPRLIDAYRAASERFFRRELTDRPELVERLLPNYSPGCKRSSVSDRYLRAFTRDNVELVTSSITKIVDAGIQTADGTLHPADVVVCATGFRLMEKGCTPSFPVYGRAGENLHEFWDRSGFQAYQGVSIPRFPNMFLITGPYGVAAASLIAMVECTARHAARAIGTARRRGLRTVEVRQRAHDRYLALCRTRAPRTFWLTPHCADSNTYYVNYQGEAAVMRPTTHMSMWWGNKHFPLRDYSFTH